MKFLNRLGDTLLGKLAPETEASASGPGTRPCEGKCPSGACMSSTPETTPCQERKYSARCCYWGGSACPVRYCSAWELCGLC